MVNLSDIYPLTGFLRDHKTHLKRLQDTGQPELLTVNGRASVVVQDAAAYQALLEKLDRLSVEEILRQRLASVEAGEPGIPMDEAIAAIREAISQRAK